MMSHPTLVPKLLRRIPGRLNCNFDRVVSGQGMKLVRPHQLAGALFEQAQLIVSKLLCPGPANKPLGRASKLSEWTPWGT